MLFVKLALDAEFRRNVEWAKPTLQVNRGNGTWNVVKNCPLLLVICPLQMTND